MSEIGLGCSGYWGNSSFDERQAIRIVKHAFDNGVNFFDTGSNYSNFNAEPRLGKALSEILSSNKRSDIIVSSKAGSLRGSALRLGHSRAQDFSPKAIAETCLRSIQNLRCDFLDIFQLHGPNVSSLTPELLECLKAMKKDGMYRYLGINTHDLATMEYLASKPGLCDMVLIDYSCLQLDREPYIAKLSSAGIGVAAGTVLAQGHLVSQKIGSIRSGAFFWYLARSMFKSSSRQLAMHSAPMREVLMSAKGFSPAQVAFSYVLANPMVGSCVFGTTNLANLSDVLKSVEISLDQSIMQNIRFAYAKSILN